MPLEIIHLVNGDITAQCLFSVLASCSRDMTYEGLSEQILTISSPIISFEDYANRPILAICIKTLQNLLK
jgi:hypothetical protein